jgi:hypothetical protein
VDALLRAGAGRDVRSGEGKTAGEYALAKKYNKIAEKLGIAVKDVEDKAVKR